MRSSPAQASACAGVRITPIASSNVAKPTNKILEIMSSSRVDRTEPDSSVFYGRRRPSIH
jgi:hypothetical protein